MPSLINGRLSDTPVATNDATGNFERADSSFRSHIPPEEVEKDRFHLFVSLACPWAHRTLLGRKLKGLEEFVSVSVVDPLMGEEGWKFFAPELGFDFLYEVYVTANANYTGKITVPVLWDKKTRSIVNNESAEILRILNRSFDEKTHSKIDLYPEALRKEIDVINNLVYPGVNNGVYRAGFATDQGAYEKACSKVFQTLDQLEDLLGKNAFLAGEYLTEADLRLFTTLLRFDPVYHGHFKCNIRRIKDYPELSSYLRCLYQHPGIQETCDFDHIKRHYYWSHPFINPTKIVPLGPELDLFAPHHRDKLKFYPKR
jgi:glutathionyl-hydroquinone reductase